MCSTASRPEAVALPRFISGRWRILPSGNHGKDHHDPQGGLFCLLVGSSTGCASHAVQPRECVCPCGHAWQVTLGQMAGVRALCQVVTCSAAVTLRLERRACVVSPCMRSAERKSIDRLRPIPPPHCRYLGCRETIGTLSLKSRRQCSRLSHQSTLDCTPTRCHPRHINHALQPHRPECLQQSGVTDECRHGCATASVGSLWILRKREQWARENLVSVLSIARSSISISVIPEHIPRYDCRHSSLNVN